MGKIKNNKIQYVFLCIYMFLYVFQPCITRFPTTYCLEALSVAYIVLTARKIPINVYTKKTIRIVFPFILYICILMIVMMLIHPSNASIYLANLKDFGLSLFHIILFVFFISLYMKRNNIGTELFIKCLITITTVQLICVILSFISYDIKQFFNSFTIKYSRAENVVLTTTMYSTRRAFGFAENLFDQFGYIVSMLTTITFAYGLFKRRTGYILLSLTFLFMSLINARTGMLLSIVGIFVVLLLFSKYLSLGRYLKGIVIFVLVVFAGTVIISSLPDVMREWVGSGYNEILALILQNERIGTVNQIFSADIVMPNDVVFGVGGTPAYFSVIGIDNGYIRLIWMTGAIGLIVLIICYISYFVNSYKASSSLWGKSMCVALPVIFFIYLSKLMPVLMPGGNAILIGIPFIIGNIGDVQDNDFKSASEWTFKESNL